MLFKIKLYTSVGTISSTCLFFEMKTGYNSLAQSGLQWEPLINVASKGITFIK